MRALALFLLLAAATHAQAQADDAAALSLADKTPAPTPQVASDWRLFAELAWAKSMLRDGAGNEDNVRLFLGVRYDKVFAPGWRAVFADLLTVRWQDSVSHQSTVNTLMDAYLSWQPTPEQIVDAGRINTRYGVAYGYNPTDYLRANAIRSIVSTDPESLRENRMCSVMTRGQTLWTGGSLSALYSPKLADQPSDSAFNLDLGATNFRDRWLVAASHEVAKGFSPHLLLYGQTGQSPQLGVNVTALVNDATVAYAEYSGGRRSSLLSQALTLSSDAAFRSQLVTGFMYTSAANLSLGLEYEYNGAGLDEASWNALRSGPSDVYAQYRAFAARAQEPPTKQRLFGNARWQDAGFQHLDLSAFAYFNLLDSSQQLWVEGRYHWTHVDAALQWQVNSGAPGTEFGALPARQTWQALVTYFF